MSEEKIAIMKHDELALNSSRVINCSVVVVDPVIMALESDKGDTTSSVERSRTSHHLILNKQRSSSATPQCSRGKQSVLTVETNSTYHGICVVHDCTYSAENRKRDGSNLLHDPSWRDVSH